MDKARLVDVLHRLGVEKLRASDRSGNMQISCPLAPWTHAKGADQSPSCSVKIDPEGASLFRCFSCGEAGTLTWLLKRLNWFKKGALDDLTKEVAEAEKEDLEKMIQQGIKKFSTDPSREEATDVEVWEEREIAEYLGQVPQYALDRGLTLETCKEWQLGYDEREGRLVFPVRRADGKLVGVTGRAIDDKIQPRYKDYWGFEKSKFLYGEHKLDRSHGRLIVVEGFMDVLKLWAFGIRNVVATMGVRASKTQLQKIRDAELDVYMFQDGDQPGRMAREMFTEALRGRVRLFDVRVPDDGDPDEMGAVQVAELIESAVFLL